MPAVPAVPVVDVAPDVVDALREAQRLGFLGARPIEETVEHSGGFVRAVDELDAPAPRIVDLGSGGGVPGLVIADQRPDAFVTLVDRRTKRTDFLERVVRRLGWSQRVVVDAGDVADTIRRAPGGFDAATARGFGPPARTLAVATQLVRPGGLIVVSEPPHEREDRWDASLLAGQGVGWLRRVDGVVVFRRFT